VPVVTFHLQLHQQFGGADVRMRAVLNRCARRNLAREPPGSKVRTDHVVARTEVLAQVHYLVLDAAMRIRPTGPEQAISDSDAVDNQLVTTKRRHVGPGPNGCGVQGEGAPEQVGGAVGWAVALLGAPDPRRRPWRDPRGGPL
jgi:hypothetical protein